MIKHIIVALILVIGLSGLGSAATEYLNYDNNGLGSFSSPLDIGYSSKIIYYTNATTLYFYWHGVSLPIDSSMKIEGLADDVKYWDYDDDHGYYAYGESEYGFITASDYMTIKVWRSFTTWEQGGSVSIAVSEIPFVEYSVSGATNCVSDTSIWIHNGTGYDFLKSTSASTYSFEILDGYSYRLLFDGVYYDFTCDGSDVTFDYDACIWVYGYSCGIDTIKLYKDDGGWVLDDTESQSTGYDVYEMPIVDGEDYKISFIDSGTVCHNQTFACTGDHVHIDYDRCEWIYPPYPPAPPIPIYIWTGYDYNIVVFRDEHGNFIENSQLAIYDKTDNQYLQRWTDAADGYTLLGTRFDTDHDVLLTLRTFDGIFTLDTTYPANGSAPVGEENITTTNWTIPIKYNLNVLPVDQYGAALFDVFCGLSEYTPLNPGAFWGMDLSDRGYVAVTNCSGFAMCDIIAEKEGYADYKVEALNWTSKSALVKDYRHNIVMEEE